MENKRIEKQNILERAIAIISPGAALSRNIARVKSEMMSIDREFYRNMKRQYNGASYGPLTKDWFGPASSANTEISKGQPTLRYKMRELLRNDPYAAQAVRALSVILVGSGIRPSISTTGKGSKEKLESSFLEWCESRNSDFYRRTNFYGNQRLGTAAMVGDGAALIIKRYRGKGKNMELALQVLEADYLVSWRTQIADDKGNYIVNGRHYDNEDRIIGYDIYKQHPGDSYNLKSSEYEFVAAENVIHLFRMERPGQGDGIPWGTSGMLAHKMLQQYLLAQSHKQVLSASITGVITTPDADSFGTPSGGTVRQGTRDGVNYENIEQEGFGPGEWRYLFPGEDVSFLPTPAVDGLDIFSKAKLREIAAAWGITYEILSGDMSMVNFASGKLGLLQMYRFSDMVQQEILIATYCDRVWEWWLELEILKGKAAINTYGLKTEWTVPAKPMVDVAKETKALIEQINAGLMDWGDGVRAFGKNPIEHAKKLQATKKLLDDHNLILSSDYSIIHEEAMKGSDKKEKVPAPK